MARLWRNTEDTSDGKYLVQRRDGTIPDWPYFVLGAADPAAPKALQAYADRCQDLGMDPEYVEDIRTMATEWSIWRVTHREGDPDAPKHRTDDPEIIAKMRQAHGA